MIEGRCDMKTSMALAVVLLMAAAAGCDRENPVEKYGTGLTDSYKRAERAAEDATLSALRGSIAAYRSANGRYPQDLKELSAFSGLEVDAEKYGYDPATGEITPR
jgi:hypothetical protein